MTNTKYRSITLLDNIVHNLEKRINLPVSKKWGGNSEVYPRIFIIKSYDITHKSDNLRKKDMEELKNLENGLSKIKESKTKKKVGKLIESLKKSHLSESIGKTDIFNIVIWAKSKSECKSLSTEIENELRNMKLGNDIIKIEVSKYEIEPTWTSLEFQVNYKYNKSDKELREEKDSRQLMTIKFSAEEILNTALSNIALSQNKNYLIAIEEPIKRGNKRVSGNIYLMENGRLLWKKSIESPERIGVSNNGVVVVHDSISVSRKKERRIDWSYICFRWRG